MIKSTEVHFPQIQGLKELIEAHTRAAENIYLNAIELAESLFGNHMPANLIVVGAAYQAGLIPLSGEAIEQAIALNGVAVEANRHAFRVGRLVVADPDWVASLEVSRAEKLGVPPELSPDVQAMVERVGAGSEVRKLLEIRVPELIAYQDEAYAQQYADFVKRVCLAEQQIMTGQTRLSQAVARYLFKLMAYKDEYEVARLHLKPKLGQTLTEQFGQGARLKYQLQPPLLQTIGLKKKIGFGRWFEPGFSLLVTLRKLRGTRFDIFGYTDMRRLERELIGEYQTVIEEALAGLSPKTYEQAVKLAELPDIIRGYEEVKLKNIIRFREEVRKIKSEAVSTSQLLG
jgi:indolepyruvate ferredoxin oxidoreductase